MGIKRSLLGLLVTVVLILALAVPASAASQFSDVGGHPYAAGIDELAAWGIVGGYPNATFRPDNLLLRQQFAKMAVLTMAYPVSTADICTFKDAPAIDPANPLYPGSYVAVAAAETIVKGYLDNTFGFYDNVTRQQVISIVVRAAGSALVEPPVGWQGIFDYSDPNHGQNIKKAEYNGLLAGIQDVYSWDPTKYATRGEAAYLLSELLAKAENPAEGASGVIKVSGKVERAVGLTVARLENLGTVTLTLEHPKNGPAEYTGVRFSALFEKLGVEADAVDMVAVASDGYTVTIKVADIKAAPDALLAIEDGMFNLAVPGASSKAWVKDVVSLEFN
jgi:hypothetical protein